MCEQHYTTKKITTITEQGACPVGELAGLEPVTMPSCPCSVNRAAAGQWQLAWAVVINWL